MKIRTCLVLGSIVAAIAVAASPEKVFSDKSDNMVVSNFEKFLIKDDNNGGYDFTVRGERVLAKWTREKFEAETKSITGKARKGKAVKGNAGNLQLVSAKMSGYVKATALRPSSKKNANQDQTIVCTSESAEYFASESKLKLSGRVHVDDDDPAAQRKLVLDGLSATVVLSNSNAKATKGIDSATVDENVQFTITGQREEVDEETKKSTLVDYKIHGRADHLVYSALKRTLVLTGNVKIMGSDALTNGNLDGVTKATIEFDEKGEPTSIDIDANPGTSTIQRKTGGKG